MGYKTSYWSVDLRLPKKPCNMVKICSKRRKLCFVILEFMFKVEAHLGLDCERKNSFRSSKFLVLLILVHLGVMKMQKISFEL